ncbi:exported hypothetical protein [Candidatus Sulfopaludibacter sp. SbA3]|nr:exported hypothetical protein [Candidatus Sulfopaludibacter sp. SbA3]
MFTRKLAWSVNGMIVAALAWSLPPVASAQSDETEVGEVAALGGATLGIGAHPAVKGSAGVAFSRYGMILFQTSFSPLGRSTLQPWPTPSTVERSYLTDFGLDFHIRIPVSHRCAPYGILGSGLLWDTIRHRAIDSQGVARTIRYDQFNGALHTGAGARYYFNESWGIRPELEVIVSHRTYTQFTVGVFYVTPIEWP